MKTIKAETKLGVFGDMYQSSVFDSLGNFIAHAYGHTKEEAEKNSDFITKACSNKFNSELLGALDQIGNILEDVKKKESSQTFEDIVRPVIKWLCENSHPHATIIITPTNAELVEGVKTTGEIMDYVKD